VADDATAGRKFGLETRAEQAVDQRDQIERDDAGILDPGR
jgi:hypothetical protein